MDILDSSYFWYTGRVVHADPTRGVHVSYDGFDEQWNEWIPPDARFRLARYKSRAAGGEESGGVFVFAATTYARTKAGNQVQQTFQVGSLSQRAEFLTCLCALE